MVYLQVLADLVRATAWALLAAQLGAAAVLLGVGHVLRSRRRGCPRGGGGASMGGGPTSKSNATAAAAAVLRNSDAINRIDPSGAWGDRR